MIETKGLTGAQTLLRVLGDMGVERIFASPGSEWSPVWEALAEPPRPNESMPLYFSSRHEEIAVGMASGYAKASGKLAAVMIHTTVGALHASMALRGALHEQVPMVVFTGESVGFGEEEGPDPGAQWVGNLADIGGPARLVDRCVKWSFGVNTKSVFPATIQRACQLAMSAPRGPVFVSLPMEHLFDKMTKDAPSDLGSAPAPTADSGGIEELAELLVDAKNPLIITEGSGRSAKIVERLVELAELLGVGIVETRSTGYLNFPRNHPLHGGYDPQEYMADADMVFLLSAMVPWHPPSKGPGPGVKVAVLDENPLRAELPYWGYKVDLCLAGEVESSLEQLIGHLKKRLPKGNANIAERADRWRKRNEDRRRKWSEEALGCKDKKPIDTRWITYELNQVLPADAMIVEETITHRLAIHRYVDKLKPGSYFAGSIGGLGTGLGTALGVKAAAPKRPVVCLIGDGSFNYDPVLGAMGFCQEYQMPIMIVIFNNYGYLSQQSGIPRYFPNGWAVKKNNFVGVTITPSPEYAVLARAFDGYGEKVEEPGEVRKALERGLKAAAAGQVAVIDIRLDPVVKA
jgi:acetolactate synthase I/II/III large subunit